MPSHVLEFWFSILTCILSAIGFTRWEKIRRYKKETGQGTKQATFWMYILGTVFVVQFFLAAMYSPFSRLP